MKQFALTLIFLFFLFSCDRNNSNNSSLKILISVNGKIGKDSLLSDGQRYSVNIDLLNNTDTTIKFLNWCCTWEQNWISYNNEKLFLFTDTDCIHNFIDVVSINPKQKKTFKGVIWVNDESIKNSHTEDLKLGFVWIRMKDVPGFRQSTFDYVLNEKLKDKKDIIWSEPFKINSKE